jgi:hypothetical protein
MAQGKTIEELTRAERRAMARQQHSDKVPNWNSAPPADRCCLFCRGPLANGRPVCSDACDHGWWQICPTLDGELYTPTA